MKQDNAGITYIVVLHYLTICYKNITSNGLDTRTTCNPTSNTDYEHHG